ncbi:single-stranded DNA-binding protein [Ornithinimicrobium sediminis]|uniref:single-stranded DNA-binding protein n=1 Tax=Ornithinimicrobium sediminis TaxID=2904603 RepID=UPI001E39CE24|nr:single-stranded DNA-binding protein [Ornithinimicrobium sediminis]MCE0487709.1 single-stranded DNA-binding protein [Ornithinimicrobium sediminis]
MAADTPHVNEVRLVGRVTGAPVARVLPSGDVVVTLRLTVDRPPPRRGDDPSRRRVDAIELACWTPRTRAAAERVSEGDVVEVTGALRRRFQRGPRSLVAADAHRPGGLESHHG